MSRIFITGSADGLGLLAAKLLISDGHDVVLHARDAQRAEEALKLAAGAETAIAGDLASIEATKQVAEQLNRLGAIDAVIHNAAIGYQEPRRTLTVDGLPSVFAINSLAPYLLTSLIRKPKRLVYISSGLHRDGDTSLHDLTWTKHPWSGFNAYADSKLHNVLLAFAAARKWPDVYSNALEPGWVATKMGGPNAPDSLEDGPKTQAWLAGSEDKEVKVSGHYFYHQKLKEPLPATRNTDLQEFFLSECERFSGVQFPQQ